MNRRQLTNVTRVSVVWSESSVGGMMLFSFSINNHIPYIYLYTNTKYIPTGLSGWVEQVSASWATPAHRVIWSANNVDPWSRSDGVAICLQAAERLAGETSNSNPCAYSPLKITLPSLLFFLCSRNNGNVFWTLHFCLFFYTVYADILIDISTHILKTHFKHVLLRV